MKSTLKIGTRGSQLALWQADWVKSALLAKDPSLSIERVIIKTTGDKILDAPLAKVGGKGLFVKEIEEALLDGRIDLAVHSMKDMPADIPEGLCIGAVPKRESPFDVLISKTGTPLAELPHGACIGTSSLRRAAQLLVARPDLDILPLRGNLDTRMRKLEDGRMDAIVLAAAGVKRLGLADRITEYIDPDVMLPAVGQGALCIETRTDDPRTASRTAALNHARTRAAVSGERAFLNRLEGSCQVPIAALGTTAGDRFTLTGLVAGIDGAAIVKDTLTGAMAQSDRIGIQLAEKLLALGADKILQQLKTGMTRHE